MNIAVLIPCYNEEQTVAQVVREFAAALPDAAIYVCDNNSSDKTGEVARQAGATVLLERNQGKGHAVRRLFSDVEADIYLMIDGDATYEAAAAPRLVKSMVDNGYDFLNGARISQATEAYRPGHRFGNWLLTGMVRQIFGARFADMLSGYKLFSRRYVKSFPALSAGFEIETELTVHALELAMPCGEEPTAYGERPEGSVSKLRTFRDGFRILVLIGNLIRNERPLPFFAILGGLGLLLALVLAIPLVATFIETGLVPRLPTAVLAASLVIVSLLAFAVGLILDTVTTARREVKRLFYRSVPRGF
jgi:glycosyltransferase involved in cell wall biosynthesis